MAVRGDKDAGFVLTHSMSHLLQRAQQMASDQFSSRLRGSSLTVRQFAVLCAIEAIPGSTQTELVNATGIDRSTLADLIHRMQDRGLLTRNRATGDARANSVTLTPAGLKAWQEAVPQAKAADGAILAVLPKSKRQGLIAALQQLSQVGLESPAAAAPKAKSKSKSKKVKSAGKATKPKKKAKKHKKKDSAANAAPPAKRKIEPPAN